LLTNRDLEPAQIAQYHHAWERYRATRGTKELFVELTAPCLRSKHYESPIHSCRLIAAASNACRNSSGGRLPRALFQALSASSLRPGQGHRTSASSVQSLLADAVLATERCRHRPRFMLLQHADDLVLSKPAAPHPVLLGPHAHRGLSVSMDHFSGGRSRVIPFFEILGAVAIAMRREVVEPVAERRGPRLAGWFGFFRIAYARPMS
jgi:hypothetical protein